MYFMDKNSQHPRTECNNTYNEKMKELQTAIRLSGPNEDILFVSVSYNNVFFCR